MVNPTAIDAMSSAMADVYASVTDRILINLAHHFQYIKDGRAPTGSFEYQSRMLAEMGQVTKESSDIIQAMLGGADEALKTVLENAIVESLKDEEPKLQQAAKLGLIGKGSIPELTPNQMQAFKAYYSQSADKLNLVNTVMLESTQAAYTGVISDIVNRINNTQSILNASAGEVITGVSAWNKAMHDAVHRMVSNGLTGFIDHAGRRWSPEAYVAMDIRTTLFNTGRAAIWERQEQYGNDLYQVSSHAGARPLCYPWQGKVISRTDLVRDVEDLDGNTVHVYAQSETTYGQAAGLFGINCKHYPMTFIPGFSTLKGEPQSEKVNEKTYEESQQQRALERKLRFEKRELSVLKAQGADQEAIKAQRNKVFEASADIDAFCDATGRARRRNREYTPINARFPAKTSYDPKLFPTEQRDKISKWFSSKKESSIVNSIKDNSVKENDTLEDLFGDLWNGNADESEYTQMSIETTQFHQSTKYGSFGIQNQDYPKDLQLTEKEEKYIENVLKDFRGEKTPKDFEYQPIMGNALRPVKTLELNASKRQAIQFEVNDATAKLEQAEQMIAQRKAEGYQGKSREQSYKDWKKLKKMLDQAEDEIEHNQILGQASIGESGIQYWYSQRKQSNNRLSFAKFATKVVDREQFALEHGFDGTNYD